MEIQCQNCMSPNEDLRRVRRKAYIFYFSWWLKILATSSVGIYRKWRLKIKEENKTFLLLSISSNNKLQPMANSDQRHTRCVAYNAFGSPFNGSMSDQEGCCFYTRVSFKFQNLGQIWQRQRIFCCFETIQVQNVIYLEISPHGFIMKRKRIEDEERRITSNKRMQQQ